MNLLENYILPGYQVRKIPREEVPFNTMVKDLSNLKVKLIATAIFNEYVKYFLLKSGLLLRSKDITWGRNEHD